eukprot:1600828-Rhodomonas_salina.3
MPRPGISARYVSTKRPRKIRVGPYDGPVWNGHDMAHTSTTAASVLRVDTTQSTSTGAASTFDFDLPSPRQPERLRILGAA